MSLHVERRGATALVTLDNPKARNAFTPEIREGMGQALATIRADADIRAVVITGAGGCFCAGGDIRGMAAVSEPDGAVARSRVHDIQRWMAELITLDRPVIAAVDGPAYGAGFSLALAADIVLASTRARFSLSFMKMGLIPDCGIFFTLPRVVGVQRAKELMLTAREVDAEEARALGIAMELHEPEQLLPRALALAERFATASPLAVSLCKRIVTPGGELASLLEAEANAQALALGSVYHRGAVQRFLAKQPPAFQWPKE
jgi:2-(1,2-epoxy-1,2-dihydrophenyl)acetyl-CoA isomerase